MTKNQFWKGSTFFVLFSFDLTPQIIMKFVKVRGETPLTNHDHRHSGLGLVASKLAQVSEFFSARIDHLINVVKKDSFSIFLAQATKTI